MKTFFNPTIEKINGRIYTPDFIVNNILDLSGYYGRTILKKHVIDNSCGDGAFLVAVVNRYCREFLSHFSDLFLLSKELSEFIHGIEIDNAECNKCILNLNKTVKVYGLNKVNWDIICADALEVNKYNGKMDFVVGNPPYVRVHNFGDAVGKIKRYSFAQSGMTDLFIVFYEIGLQMLNAYGVLGYITPSSYFNSLAGKRLRSYLVENNLIDKIVDLKHFQAFAATTYTSITILHKNRQKNTVEFYQFDSNNNIPYYVDTLSVNDFYIKNSFYFAEKNKLNELREILNFNGRDENFIVKNGFATLDDKFFIGDFNFDSFTIPVVKASTGKMYKCIFPYVQGKLIPYNDLTANAEIKSHYETYKERLLNRSFDERNGWYGFGRTQGINDVYRNKYAVNALIKTSHDLKLIRCDKGVGVYSGLYILTKTDETELKNILYSDDFISYISLLGKYKNGGYYTFSSKELKNYLEYKFTQRNFIKNGQSSVFGNT